MIYFLDISFRQFSQIKRFDFVSIKPQASFFASALFSEYRFQWIATPPFHFISASLILRGYSMRRWRSAQLRWRLSKMPVFGSSFSLPQLPPACAFSAFARLRVFQSQAFLFRFSSAYRVSFVIFERHRSTLSAFLFPTAVQQRSRGSSRCWCLLFRLLLPPHVLFSHMFLPCRWAFSRIHFFISSSFVVFQLYFSSSISLMISLFSPSSYILLRYSEFLLHARYFCLFSLQFKVFSCFDIFRYFHFFFRVFIFFVVCHFRLLWYNTFTLLLIGYYI